MNMPMTSKDGQRRRYRKDATASSSGLSAEGLCAGYNGVAVVRDLSIDVRPGEVVALFGPNGAGKSTVLHTLAGQLPKLKGEITWNGLPTVAQLHRRARTGLSFVPEEHAIIRSMTVRQNLQLVKGAIGRTLELFPELKPLLGRPAGLLSGGEQRILSVGRALAAGPTLLLADELSLGLAPLIVQRLLDVIRQAADDDGIAVLIVEQQARRALAVADRWYLLRNGSVVANGDRGSGSDQLEAAYLADVSRTIGPAESTSVGAAQS
jgi:branched-chain amino acid transport system ATP-binding protein